MVRKSNRKSPRLKSVLITREVLCSMSGISERELLVWEHEDLIAPAQVERRERAGETLYEMSAVERARVIRSLAEDLEVNLAGIGVILNLLERLRR